MAETASNPQVEPLVGRIADEFTNRLNGGERPSVEEYLARYPDLATVLAQVLPILEVVRQCGGSDPANPGEPPNLADRSGATDDGGDLAERAVEGRLGDFRIVREIGRGGMGIVYEAEQISLRRRVALKVLPFAAVLDPRQLQRFKNEALAAAQLKHPHIVDVYGVGCERGVHHYAMEFIEGQTLAEVIAALSARLPPLGRGGQGGSAGASSPHPSQPDDGLLAAGSQGGARGAVATPPARTDQMASRKAQPSANVESEISNSP